jgi:hypothetical protein
MIKTRRINMRLGGTTYTESWPHPDGKEVAGFPKLCATELSRYVDLGSPLPPLIVLTLTNQQPRGNNYHEFRWSRSKCEWTLRGVRGFGPAFYGGFQMMLSGEFKKSHTVYAWIRA